MPKKRISRISNPPQNAKRKKTESFPLEELPNEVILKVFTYLEVDTLIFCGQMNRRIRAISHDESLV